MLLNYFIADYLEMIIHCQLPLLEDFRAVTVIHRTCSNRIYMKKKWLIANDMKLCICLHKNISLKLFKALMFWDSTENTEDI